MGNCLDIPPPPPKRYPAYLTRPRYFMATRMIPPASDSLVPNPRAYSTYQPYADFGRSRPIMDFDPFTGNAYTHRLNPPTAIPAYYADPIYMTGSAYDYYGKTKQKTSYRQRETRYRHKDHVRDHEIHMSKDTKRARNGVISTEEMAASGRTTTTSTIAMASQAREDNSGQASTSTVQSDVIPTSAATPEKTGFPCIDQQTLTSEPAQEEITVDNTTEIFEDIHSVQTEVDVPLEKNHIDGFFNTDETVGDLLPPVHDEPETETAVASTSGPTLASISLNSLKKQGNANSSSYTPPDVVLCYHSADAQIMEQIKNKLQTAKLNTAVSYPTDGMGDDGFVDWLMFPQAVVDAKVMVVLLSHHSVKDKHLKDEICLAQITETLIYPVALEKSLDVLGDMDADMKLQLKCYKWIELGDSQDFAVALMIRSIKEDLESMRSFSITVKDGVQGSERAHRRQKIFRQRQVQKMVKLGEQVNADQYWKNCYGSGSDSIPFERFYEDLCKEYKKQLKDIAYESCSPNFVNSLKREMGIRDDEIVYKTQFVEFGNNFGIDQDVWERIHCVARETQAIRDVLDMESTVRIVAIENIGKFGSQNTINALRELLTDKNPNIRAVASLSLSRAIPEGDQVTFTALMATLDDQDELVRQTGCLVLGHLRAKEAVGKLSHMCGNDAIAQVREAATVALNQIEGTTLNQDVRVSDAEADESNNP